MKMKQIILERNLESRFTPKTVKEKKRQQLYSKPTDLGNKLAEESLKKLSLKSYNYN